MATSLAQTSATTTLYVSNGQPATYDAAGFTALSWTKVGELSNIGTLGGQTTVVTHIPVDTGVVVKRAGSQNNGSMQMQGARCTDAGQTILRTAFNSRASISYKVVYPSVIGQTDYFTGICTSNQTNVGTADQILGYNAQVEVDNSILTV